MKFFSPYTLICALALTETTLASSFTSSAAAQVSEHFGIPGLHESPDLHWFTTRWNQNSDNNFVKRALVIDVQDPAIFSGNRAALTKYCIEHVVSHSEFDSLIRVLVDIGEYEYVIHEYCQEPSRFTHMSMWSDAQYENLFAALKHSTDMAAFYETLNSVELISLFSVRMYVLSILDVSLPQGLYVAGLSTKGDMVLDVVLEAVRLFKPSLHHRAYVVHEHLLAVLNHFRDERVAGKLGVLLQDLAIIVKAVKMVRDLRNGYSCNTTTMRKLDISNLEWAGSTSMGHGIVLTMAAYTKNWTLIREIYSKMATADPFLDRIKDRVQDRVEVFEYFLNEAKYHGDREKTKMALASLGQLPRDMQDAIKKTDDFFDFLIRRLKVTGTELRSSSVSFYFVYEEDDIREKLKSNPILYRYDFAIPTTVEQIKRWFIDLKFSSPDSLFEFIRVISMLGNFPELVSECPIAINFENFVQIAVYKKLIRTMARLNLQFYLYGCDEDVNMSAFLKRENIWNMKRIIPADCLGTFITPEIHGESMWRNFDRFCGGQLPDFLRRTFEMYDGTDESNYFRYRHALIHVMNGRHREVIENISNPEFRLLLVKDFPELEATV